MTHAVSTECAVEIRPASPGADHELVFVHGQQIGFLGRDGRFGLERCAECGLENYAPAVMGGQCVWCGWKLDEIDLIHAVSDRIDALIADAGNCILDLLMTE
jgi:hypothetical protein